jgi:hypothetical protein
MKPVVFLRTASVLTLLQAVLHTIGGVFGTPPPGAQAAVSAMKTVQFPVAGLTRSYWDFYIGFGLAISVMLAVEGIVFWQLGSLCRKDAWRMRPILAAFLVGYLALAADATRFFFPPPIVGDALIALCLALAILTARPAIAD